MRLTQISHSSARLGTMGWVCGYLNNVRACEGKEGADKQTNNQISVTWHSRSILLSPFPFLSLKKIISWTKNTHIPAKNTFISKHQRCSNSLRAPKLNEPLAKERENK